jgi:hypothetical protein
MAMAMAINSTARAVENMEYVRSLLKQRQPEFAAALERAAMLAEKTPQSHGDVSFSAGRRGGGSASSDDAEGEQCGTAALHEVSDLMPVEAVGVDLGQRLGNPESLEL